MKIYHGVTKISGYLDNTGEEISRVVRCHEPEDGDIDVVMLEHVSPIEWGNVILYGNTCWPAIRSADPGNFSFFGNQDEERGAYYRLTPNKHIV